MTPEPVPKSDLVSRDARLPTAWRGLTLQLFLVTVLPLTILLVAIALGSLELHQREMRDLVGERDMLAVHTAAAAITEQVQQRAHVLRLAAAAIAAAPTAITREYEFLADDFDLGLAIYQPDGVLLAAHDSHTFWEAFASQIPAHSADLLARLPEALILSNGYRHPQTGEALLIILAFDPAQTQIIAGGFTAASVAGRVFLDSLSMSAHSATTFLLVDASGIPIYRSSAGFETEPISAHPGVAEALRGQSGATYQRIDGSEQVIAYSGIPALGWGLISEEAWDMVDSPQLRSTQIAPLVLVPALLLALLGLTFAVRQIVRPLQQLQARSAELAHGDFAAIEASVGGIAEIRQLQAGLIDMARQVQAAQRSLHDYIGAITSAQEDERRRLARELHDDTIQSLIALKQRLYLARMDSDHPSAGALDEITNLTEETIENLRRVTRALRPIYLEDLGLATGLQMLARETGQTAGIPVSFRLEGRERRLAPEIELALYRMAQEALSNVARHSRAAQAEVKIVYAAERVVLTVNDDGIGFNAPVNPAAYAPGGHYGLLGLRERADLIGARLEITSAPGQGTQVRIEI